MAGKTQMSAKGQLAGVTQGFKTGEFIVYPAHGVGQIVGIEEQEVAGAKLEMFVINFVKHGLMLRVPTAKIVAVGMRKIAEGPLHGALDPGAALKRFERAIDHGRAGRRNTRP